jgi:UDP-N-acetylglucosamine 4,6-dehydratase
MRPGTYRDARKPYVDPHFSPSRAYLSCLVRRSWSSYRSRPLSKVRWAALLGEFKLRFHSEVIHLLDNKVVLITGGTGSFGQTAVETLLGRYDLSRLVVFSRDELKQFEMQQRFPESRYPAMRYFIGDVRDRDRLYRAFDGVDVVIHAAAMKQVPACEYNPLEAIRTNVMGAANVIDAAIDRGVGKVLALSTDKAANPINLYGATKLASDKLFTAANNYAGDHPTRFSVVRYGNVVGSRGSVIPLFLEARGKGQLSITDRRMTRFWITLQQGVDFVLDRLESMKGGEIFVPKIPSMRIVDVAATLAPHCEVNDIGIRPGEKLHETMVTVDDARTTRNHDDYFEILPADRWRGEDVPSMDGKPCPEGFEYCSDQNDIWLTSTELLAMVENLGAGE